MTGNNGVEYATVKIGTQWWMAENLKETHYRNGSEIPYVTAAGDWSLLSTGACWMYNNNQANADVYGYLYNWYAVNDSRQIAPAGWHVPSDAEWQILIDYLGGDTVAGGKLKESGTVHWMDPNAGGTDEYGFAALPGGGRHDDGNLGALRYGCNFWTASAATTVQAWVRHMGYEHTEVYHDDADKRYGFSVRLIRDE